MQSRMRARLLGVADHRQHDALGAHVGGAGDVVIFLRRHAHDRRHAGRLEIADRALDRLEAEAGMLGVEQHEIAAGRLQDVADAGRGELDDEMAELQLARTAHLLQAWRRHPVVPPFCSLEAAFSRASLPPSIYAPPTDGLLLRNCERGMRVRQSYIGGQTRDRGARHGATPRRRPAGRIQHAAVRERRARPGQGRRHGARCWSRPT